jgi:hypothetical protein
MSLDTMATITEDCWKEMTIVAAFVITGTWFRRQREKYAEWLEAQR